MRITTLLILIFALHVSAKTSAQTITLSSDKITVEQFFNQLKKQTGYSFLLENGVVSQDLTLSVHVKNASLEQALDEVLKPLSLSYKIENKIVYIIKSPTAVPQSVTNLSPPPIDIHGRVTDSLGSPLSGASIFIKGTKRGAISDANGYFVLNDVSETQTIIISFTGYVSREFKINSDGDFKIMLSKSNNPLDQVQIIAYGTTTQRLSTGDVTTVKAEDLEKQPVSNPLAAMEGRVPGLVITQTTGAPGGAFTVQLRGQSSIINGNDPFYVIDGVPYPSQTLGLINSTLHNGNPLNFINISDIESIEILKDADATSIYGSRAANGAILITTRKGKAGKMRIDVNAYTGLGDVTREPKLFNTPQYLGMRNGAFLNDGVTPTVDNAPDLLLWDTTRYTDWQKVLLGNSARYNDIQASVSGGNANTQYMVGAGYHRENTVYPVILPGQGADKKASVYFNILTTSDNKKFKVSLTGSYLSDVNTVQPNDFNGTAVVLPPDAPPIYNPDGTLNWAPITPGEMGTWNNPYAELYQTYKGNTYNLVGNGVVSYTILSGLEAKVSLGYTNTQTNEVMTVPTTNYDPATVGVADYTYGQFNATNTHSWIVEPQVNYHLNFGKAGTFSTLVGMTFQDNSANVSNIYATGYTNDALLGDLGSASSLSPTTSSSDYKYNAFFARLTYNLQDKYIINLTGRRDGSSRFGPGKQFANFGSVGASWIFSNEDFFKHNVSFISFGKLKGSFGTSGNDQIGDYRFLDLYSPTTNPYQGIQNLYPRSLFNPDLAWELDKKIEGGIELGFLKDRIFISANYFRSRSGNQLVKTPLSLVTGFSSIPSNLPALVQNSGLEMMFNSTNIKTKYFTWTSSFNISIPRNELVSFPNLVNTTYKYSFVVGQPITIKKVFHLIGVNDTTGIYQFQTAQGAPTYNPASNVDNTAIENTAPQFYGGFDNNFQYKGFSLDIFFQFVKQKGVNLFANIPSPGTQSNQPVPVLNSWQKLGDIKPLQQYSQDYSGVPYNSFISYFTGSDYVYSDASFIRLKNVSLSYAFPAKMIEKLHFQALRVFIQGQNLLTFTNYVGTDPESQTLGLPPLRVWTAGLHVTL